MEKQRRIFKASIITVGAVILLIVAILLWDPTAGAAVMIAGGNSMNKIQNSRQFRAGKFHNWHAWPQPGLGGYIDMTWQFLFAGGERTPKNSLPKIRPDLDALFAGSANRLASVWLGHSSLLINLDGYKIAADPVLQKRVSIFGPTRYNGDAPVHPSQIKSLDLVLISHNHYDHLNKWTIQQLAPKTAMFVVPLGVRAQLQKWGVPAEKIREMDWWEEFQYRDLTIACTPTQHFSGRGIWDRDKTLWASFVVKGPQHKIYFGGDSGYFEGFQQIGEKYGPFDVTFLECGAYDPRWHHIHMFPEETVQAHRDLKGKVLHPIHWGTFNLALHDWYEPMERFLSEAKRVGISYATSIIGGMTVYPDELPQTNWWRIQEKENYRSTRVLQPQTR